MPDIPSKVDELAALLDEHGLTAIKVKDGDLSIELRRDAAVSQIASVSSSATTPKSMGDVIPSPMVGVFYCRPSPAEDPYVEPGERVSVGQVIGMIEAMKVFNEIESPAAGVLRERLVEDGTVVQEGDPLFILEA
jgi:acetyl-CoA carboxylase biotin carboxyl carrier protein